MTVRPVGGGISSPRGFQVAAARAGLRSGEGPDVDLRLASGSGVAWGSVLSAGYVAISSEYRT